MPRITTGPWPANATLLIIAALSGTWSITGRILTFNPELLIPSAIGVPFGIPQLRAVHHPAPVPRRMGATILSVCAGNLVRIVFTSVVTHQGIGGSTLTVLLGLLVSALWGTLVGLLVSAIHLFDARRRTREPSRRRAHSAHVSSTGDGRKLADRGRAVSVSGDR